LSSRKATFQPVFTITPETASDLGRIDAVKYALEALPITPRVLANLRESAKLFSTHYSTMIEGNLLTQEQVNKVVKKRQHFPGRERDEKEVLGYYAALDEVERLSKRSEITEKGIQTLHAFVMGGGKLRPKPTPYRDGQNVIRDSRTGGIVYMPPEAKAVPALMQQMVEWINAKSRLPIPLKAAIAHYQFATIHPYYDGNGRTARLLTTLILHMGGYGLKGLYALEEYYAQNLRDYYAGLSVGPSHNYHLGRAESDITPWVSYFVEGMATSFEKVQAQAKNEALSGATDHALMLRDLNPMQRKLLHAFADSSSLTSQQIAEHLGITRRGATYLCKQWLEQGFLKLANTAKKNRTYRLSEEIAAAL